MRLAVGSLVDRATLGRRLLEAAAEVLRLEWGALYLADGPGRPLQLVASHGPAPDEQVAGAGQSAGRPAAADADGPALARHGARATAADPATDAMIALGGEAATALGDDGAARRPAGPRPRSGAACPTKTRRWRSSARSSSVATLVLHSADIQQTLESLNQELRDKVDKIAEQQRRILILQDQLRDRAGASGRRRASAEPGGVEPRPVEGDGDPGVFDAIKGSSAAVRKMIGMARKVAASPRPC